MIDHLEVRYKEKTVGTLALGRDSLCRFEYSPQWLEEGFSISPFELPLQKRVFTAQATPFEGGFGVFDDSLPDGWGLLVLDRLLRKKGINPSSLNLLDRLSIVGSSGRGALEYFPVKELTPPRAVADLDQLAREAKGILQNDDCSEGIEEFQYRGGSPGGARPKVFTTSGGREWLVKFPAREDSPDIGRKEYEYSVLAKRCGIVMTETRLFNDRYFGTERFDRDPSGERIHVVSVGGLLRADYRIPSIDYLHIFKVARVLTKNEQDLWQIYRLMVFNYLIGNKDDHAKNFAFLYKNGGWRFAPAYDLLPSDGFNGFHTTTINEKGSPTAEDLLAVAVKAGLDKDQAARVMAELSNIVSS